MTDAAHAVRGPYAAALPALELLLDGLLGDVTPSQLAAVETAEHAVCRAARTASDIVTLAGAGLACGRERPDTCGIAELVHSVTRVCRLTGVPVPEVTAEHGLPPVLVDKPLTASVLTVLCGRVTVEASEPAAAGIPQIRVELPGDSSAGAGSGSAAATVVVKIAALGTGAAVTDTGMLIPADSWSDDRERERDAALILCRGIIERAGGGLWKGGAGRPAFLVHLPAAAGAHRRPDTAGSTGDR